MLEGCDLFILPTILFHFPYWCLCGFNAFMATRLWPEVLNKKATSWKCSKIVCEFPTGELKKARKSPVGTAALHRRGCRRKLGGWCACFQCTSKVHYCKVQKCINVKFKSALMQSALVYHYKCTELKSIFPVGVVFRQCSNTHIVTQ